MQIKTTTRYHLTWSEWPSSKKKKNLSKINAAEGVEKRKPSCPVAASAAASLQSCLTSTGIDDSPPGSTIPGILQARTLEWVVISFSNA